MTELVEEESKTLEVVYDQQLVDDIVYKGLAKQEASGDLALYKEYHEKRDAIYEMDEESRPRKFRELDNDFFNRLGCDVYIKEIFDEYPDIEEKIESVHVRRATTKQNEGSNVVDEGRKVIIRLYPEIFIEGSNEIRRVIRHELMHVSDMMNEKFEYNVNEEFSNSPMEERIMRDRYRLFWDISVDGRLTNNGLEAAASREERKREFDSFFSKIPEESRELIFSEMWDSEEPMTHNKMVELSKDTNKVLALAVGSRSAEELVEDTKKLGPLPGTTCTLCGFPSFDWVEEAAEDDDIVKVLKEDFPDWEPQDGVCSRCAEYYKVKAGKW
ncbi:MAG: hypothetical protein MAG551_00802 [Candidatus Scalindua arabica]|uniref:Uncharacterized protein n=1 Tax=Candidatus Scalindua arabica TaxID=1127984 RepID=A0A941W4C1_9BACT|nr:hypothetical protein [Candidatus Scalindua arabica]